MHGRGLEPDLIAAIVHGLASANGVGRLARKEYRHQVAPAGSRASRGEIGIDRGGTEVAR